MKSTKRVTKDSCSQFWRSISWVVGDEHADRICKLVDIYCWLYKVDVTRFYEIR